jgi:histidine triad (HIT) family protein
MSAYDRNNVFARILRGELPCKKVYEDEFALAFHDVNPQAPVHVLVIHKGEYVSNMDFSATAPADVVAGFWRAVGTVARQLGLEQDGYRLVANNGAGGGQVVFHFHVHIVSGKHRPRYGRVHE